jgi:hypothetical protein
MYTAISLATYRQAAAVPNNGNAQQTRVPFLPPLGPYSAYLVFQGDEEAAGRRAWGWGYRVQNLPFPQDKCLKMMDDEDDTRSYFIPVLGQPISSNRYYVVQAAGLDKGLVVTCSKEEDIVPCCLSNCIDDISPGPLEPNNPYQQIQIIPEGHRFNAKCITSDGFPPRFLRWTDWRIEAKDLRGELGRLACVRGENVSLRAQSPPFNFSLSEKRSPIVTVGEWYCPFIFINEKGNRFEHPKNQLMETPFYKMHLEKFWEEIYSTEVGTGREEIFVDRTIRVEEALLLGSEAVEESRENDGSVWMKGLVQENGKLNGVRVSWPIIAKMRADQGREGSEALCRDVRVEKSFNNSGIGRKFVCCIVVERYVLKRIDGSLVLTYTFRHCDQIKGKWGFK